MAREVRPGLDAVSPSGPTTDAPTHIAVPMAAVAAAVAAAEPPPGIRPRQLTFGFSLLLFWVLLLMFGHEVNTSWARKIVAHFVNSKFLPAEAPAVTPVEVPSASIISTQTLSLSIKLGDNVLESRTIEIPREHARSVPAPPPTDPVNFIKALMVTLFAWTWPNLILLSATASAFASCFCRRVEKISDLATEIGWSVVNGMFVVSILACSQVFLGDSVDKSLGISSALKVNLLQENYMRLAFFSSLLGMFLGLAESRVSSMCGRLPVIGKIIGSAQGKAS